MPLTGAAGWRVQFCDLIHLEPSGGTGGAAAGGASPYPQPQWRRLLCGKFNRLTCLITDKRSEWDIRRERTHRRFLTGPPLNRGVDRRRFIFPLKVGPGKRMIFESVNIMVSL